MGTLRFAHPTVSPSSMVARDRKPAINKPAINLPMDWIVPFCPRLP